MFFFAIQNLVDIQSSRFRWYSFVFERTQSRLFFLFIIIYILYMWLYRTVFVLTWIQFYLTCIKGLYRTIASRRLVTSARHVGLSRSAVQYLFTPINAMSVWTLSRLRIGYLVSESLRIGKVYIGITSLSWGVAGPIEWLDTMYICAYNINEERGVFVIYVSRVLAIGTGIFGDKVHILMRKYPPPPQNQKKGTCSDKDLDPSF